MEGCRSWSGRRPRRSHTTPCPAPPPGLSPGARLNLHHQTGARGLRVGAEHGAGLGVGGRALWPEEEALCSGPEMEASCLNSHGVPRSPLQQCQQGASQPRLTHLCGRAPRDASFGSAPSLSKPKYPSPTSVLDANSVPGQLVYPGFKLSRPCTSPEGRRDGGRSQRAQGHLTGHSAPWKSEARVLGPTVASFCLPSPRLSPCGLFSADQRGCSWAQGRITCP